MKRHHWMILAAWVPLLAIAPHAAAQNDDPADPGYQPAIRYPDQGFSWLRHSSTIGEGHARGVAALTRAMGAANYDHSLAALNYQEAYRRGLENAVRRTEAYYARRDLWYDYQEARRRERLTFEGYANLAESKAPDRLASEQFDPETGQLMWPHTLDGEAFLPLREQIEARLMERSVQDSGYGSRNYEEIRRLVGTMRQMLQAEREMFPSHLYVRTQMFLDSVEWEARFLPAEDRVVAAENAPAPADEPPPEPVD
jgi:hypothetical protein